MTSMVDINSSAWVGSFALCWGALCRLAPVFADINLADSTLPSIVEFREAHASLRALHREVRGVYDAWGPASQIFGYDKAGEQLVRFLPSGLPPADTLLPISEFRSSSKFLQNAQRRWASIVHHSKWVGWFKWLVRQASRREVVRAIAVCQPHAGAFLNAIPSRSWARFPTSLLHTTVRLRLGLPIPSAAGKHINVDGVDYDRHGDVASSDPEHGHSTRHTGVLHLFADILQSVFGTARVLLEPKHYDEYSPGYRPDLVLLSIMGSRTGVDIGDTKIKSPLSSKQENIGMAGTQVAMGNTLRPTSELMVGTRARGDEGDGAFNPATGNGYVAEKAGDYAGALALEHRVWVLLFETLGGFSPDVVKWLRYTAHAVHNKLSRTQYDETTWGARTWMSFQTQRLSVCLHKAVAFELNAEHGHCTGPLY